LLKERLKNKEDEIIHILQKQKEEYDILIREKDEEISKLLDQLVLENTDLKRQIINMEIDYECLKESFDENMEKLKELEKNKVNAGETFQNTNSLVDKQFFNNLKNIEEDHNKKQKEINDKYDNLFKGLNREHRANIANIKKLCFENKNKFVNNKIEEEELLSIPQVEELVIQFENKVKLIYEEMKNKEKYISAIEQKYEMINEENKFLRRKVTEEKTILLKQIEDVQRERDNHHNQLVKQFEEEIASKKKNLQKQIEQSLESNEKLVLTLTKERDDLREKVDGLKKNINDVRSELTLSVQEREELDALVMGRDLTIKGLNEKIEAFQKDINSLILEKVNLTKENQELNSKLQDLLGKNLNLELNNKRLNENITVSNTMFNKMNDNNHKLETDNSFDNLRFKENMDKLKLENQEFLGKIKILTQEKDEEKSLNIIT
jgi:chromosome segregation ATPase